MKVFFVPFGLLVAFAVSLCALPVEASAQGPETPPAPVPRTWWWSAGLGLTDLSADQDTPGSMTSLRLERRSERSLSLYAEGGIGLIHQAGHCEALGGRRVECVKHAWWPDLGLGLRMNAYRPSASGLYLLGELGWQGPDLEAYLDTGIGVAFSTAAGFEVGAEIRGRKGWGSGLDGAAYFFRIARPLGGGDRADGGDGSG
jgi:hypothetical protein